MWARSLLFCSIHKGNDRIADRELRINEKIRAREVRLIGDAGEQLGIVAIEDALNSARNSNLDLVEVAPTADPPVCRILDHGKYVYEQTKKQREARKHQKNTLLKEVRFRPKIDRHDVAFKTNQVARFLGNGDKVKITVMFRGREITHPELGRKILDNVCEFLGESAVVERSAIMEGRFMSMILTAAQKPPKQKDEAPPEKAAAQ